MHWWEHDIRRRERPWLQWSMRLLLLLMTLVCAYAACWRPTYERGPRDIINQDLWVSPDLDVFSLSARAVAPLVVTSESACARTGAIEHRYYLWFFGRAAVLPFRHRQQGPIPLVQGQSGPT